MALIFHQILSKKITNKESKTLTVNNMLKCLVHPKIIITKKNKIYLLVKVLILMKMNKLNNNGEKTKPILQ